MYKFSIDISLSSKGQNKSKLQNKEVNVDVIKSINALMLVGGILVGGFSFYLFYFCNYYF